MVKHISSVQWLSPVWLFVTPWTATHQASLSITNSWNCSNSCPSNWWWHPTIWFSIIPFPSHLQSFPASGSFPMHQLFASGGQSTGVSASASVLPMNTQDWFLLGLSVLISLLSKELSESSPTPQFKSINSTSPSLLYGPTLTSIRDYWKIKVLTIQTFVGKVMSLLYNMLSRLVIAFLPRNKHLLILRLKSSSAVILESKKIKSVTVSIVSPSICHKVMGLDAMIIVFWMLSFKPALSLSSFTLIKRLFSYCLLSAIRVVSSAYLRILILLPIILIPACPSSNPGLHMMYSAYKLDKQGDSI